MRCIFTAERQPRQHMQRIAQWRLVFTGQRIKSGAFAFLIQNGRQIASHAAHLCHAQRLASRLFQRVKRFLCLRITR